MIPMAPGFFRPVISGLSPILWFDASDATKIVVNGSNEVESITCKVTDTVWSQGTAGNRPIFGSATGFSQNVMDFNNDGSNKYLTGDPIDIPIECTAFFVLDWSTNALYRAVGLLGGNATNSISSQTGQPTMIIYSTISGSSSRNMQIYSGGDYCNNTSGTLGTPAVAAFNIPDDTAANTTLYWNDAVQSLSYSGGTYGTSFPFITLGSTDSTYLSKGYVAEVIIYPGSLTEAQMTSIVTALQAKWFS